MTIAIAIVGGLVVLYGIISGLLWHETGSTEIGIIGPLLVIALFVLALVK